MAPANGSAYPRMGPVRRRRSSLWRRRIESKVDGFRFVPTWRAVRRSGMFQSPLAASARSDLRSGADNRPFSGRFARHSQAVQGLPYPTTSPDAEILEHDSKPHVRLKERGRSVLYRLTKDGEKYLKPSKCWYFDIPNQNGKPKRTKGFTDLKATETLALEKLKRAERLRSG